MKITIEIATDNAAFEDNRSREVARIVRVVADRISRDAASDHDSRDSWRLQDNNGNTVGRATIDPLA